jgi:hypothetical protein
MGKIVNSLAEISVRAVGEPVACPLVDAHLPDLRSIDAAKPGAR